MWMDMVPNPRQLEEAKREREEYQKEKSISDDWFIKPEEVVLMSEFRHRGLQWRVVTWRSDGHSRLRLIMNPVPVGGEARWVLVWRE